MEILHQYIKATSTQDFDEVSNLLHPNAVYFFSKETCTTHEEIQAFFENTWSIIKNEVYEAKDIQWLHKGNDSATCTYTYVFEGFVNEKFVQGQGRATNVFVKEGDKWMLIHEHLSAFPE